MKKSETAAIVGNALTTCRIVAPLSLPPHTTLPLIDDADFAKAFGANDKRRCACVKWNAATCFSCVFFHFAEVFFIFFFLFFFLRFLTKCVTNTHSRFAFCVNYALIWYYFCISNFFFGIFMRFSCSLYLLLTQKPLRDFGSSALISFWIFFLSFSRLFWLNTFSFLWRLLRYL